jgi:hypothetical protein
MDQKNQIIKWSIIIIINWFNFPIIWHACMHAVVLDRSLLGLSDKINKIKL